MHPGIFWLGLGAASVPVIIHLLNRRRFKVLDWAAMRFLMESVRKNRRRLQIEELILLALRCLAVLLLGMAVGRFMGCSAAKTLPIPAARAQMTHVFVLDDSASTGQRLADTTVFGKAASDLSGLIKDLPPSDRLAVLLTSRSVLAPKAGDKDKPKSVDAFLELRSRSEFDADQLVGRLRAMKPSDTSGGLAAALRAAREMLEPEKTEKRVYILSDFRRGDYGVGGEIEEMRKEMQTLREAGAKLVLMSYGAAPSANLTIEKVEVLNKLVLVGVPVRVQLSVKNNGPNRVEAATVQFSARSGEGNEIKLPVRTIASIDAGATELVQVACTLSDPGPAVITAQLPGDNLPADNTATLALDVHKTRSVLVIDGKPDVGDPQASASFFLAAAIDPGGDRSYGNEVEVAPVDRIAEISFDRYDAVVLANVGELAFTTSPDGKYVCPQLEALAKYVAAGGGLAVWTGDRVSTTFYNGPFYNFGAGLLPMRIGPPAGDPARGVKFVRLLRDSIAPDTVMRSFQGDRSQFTQFVRFYGYTPAESSPTTAAATDLRAVRVLARFDNSGQGPEHTPAIVARSHGDGMVLLICTSPDTSWTDWPKDLTYVPFVNDVLDFLSRGGGGNFTSQVGRPIEYGLSVDLASARAALQTPAYPVQDLVALQVNQAEGGRRSIAYDPTVQAGLYQLKLTMPDESRLVFFARNVDGREGRLDVAGQQDLRTLLGVEFEYRDQLAPASSEGSVTATDKSEYWKLALLLMLVVLAAEVYLGQRFGHYR